MSELNQGNGIFSGVSFEGEITENQVVENAGTIDATLESITGIDTAENIPNTKEKIQMKF